MSGSVAGRCRWLFSSRPPVRNCSPRREGGRTASGGGVIQNFLVQLLGGGDAPTCVRPSSTSLSDVDVDSGSIATASANALSRLTSKRLHCSILALTPSSTAPVSKRALFESPKKLRMFCWRCCRASSSFSGMILLLLLGELSREGGGGSFQYEVRDSQICVASVRKEIFANNSSRRTESSVTCRIFWTR